MHFALERVIAMRVPQGQGRDEDGEEAVAVHQLGHAVGHEAGGKGDQTIARLRQLRL